VGELPKNWGTILVCYVGGYPWKPLVQTGFDKCSSSSKVKGSDTYCVIVKIPVYINDSRCRELVLAFSVVNSRLLEQEIACIKEDFSSLSISGKSFDLKDFFGQTAQLL